jgi:hypothetical protein
VTPLTTEPMIIVPVVTLVAEVELKHAFIVLNNAGRDGLDGGDLTSTWAFCSDLPKPVQPGLFVILESVNQSLINQLQEGILPMTQL